MTMISESVAFLFLTKRNATKDNMIVWDTIISVGKVFINKNLQDGV